MIAAIHSIGWQSAHSTAVHIREAVKRWQRSAKRLIRRRFSIFNETNEVREEDQKIGFQFWVMKLYFFDGARQSLAVGHSFGQPAQGLFDAA